jgi:hypothetical protein
MGKSRSNPGKWEHRIDSRTHILMEFPPAKNGREPRGFSGAGAWYHDPGAKPSHNLGA